MTQGYLVLIPWEDFEASPITPVCRAASGSAPPGAQDFMGAGEQTPQDTKEQNPFQFGVTTCTGEGEITTQDNTEQQDTIPRWYNFDTADTTAPGADGNPWGAPGAEVITIRGGAKLPVKSQTPSPTKIRMQNTYASTTECILQNLSMTVGSRCFANAPWRAFTWTCALLQETHTEPWGTLHAAVQESLELAEAVDTQALPGLHRLWKKRDLNVQGDANHFVNTLWNLSQSRDFHYRYAEIKPGGYLADHVQLPLLVDYHDWPENTTLQTLMNGWVNEGLGQYLMDDKPILVTHITRSTRRS